MKRPFRGAVVSLLLLSLPSLLHSAAQNKVILKSPKWQVAQTEHFDVYYYPGAERLLPAVTTDLEKAYSEVTKVLGFTLPYRAPFFFFLNHNSFEQNNIVEVGEGTGGVTEAFKGRFLVFNDGTQAWLEHVVTHEFTHVCQFHILYDGFWRSVRLLKSVLYPLWFMEGMSEYTSGAVDQVQEDLYLRDAVTSHTLLPLMLLHGFNHVKPHQVTLAYKTGGAAVRFIAEEYGEDKIGALLRSIADKFDMSSAIEEVLGLPMPQFDAKFREWLEEEYTEQARGLKEPEAYGRPLTKPDELYPAFDSSPTFLPDGKRFVYISDKNGYNDLFVYDLSLSRAQSLDIQKKFPSKVENIHRDGSALSVSPDGRWILFSGEREQTDYLYLYDLHRDRLKRLKLPLAVVVSPQFSPDGRTIAFVGMKDGLNDIYLCKRNGRGLRRLTDTYEDENAVRFTPDGRALVFSRESLEHNRERSYERDLWMLEIDGGRETRLTSLPGDENQPDISPDGKEIVFEGDGTGVPNLYRMSLEGRKPVQLTSVVGGNFYPAYSPDGKSILFVSHRRGEEHVYLGDLNQLPPLPEPEVRKSPAAGERPVPAHSEIASSTGTLIRFGRPYGFRASTDFFFPVLFYSSVDGLYASAYWQASEMLGNHQVQGAVTYASAFDFLNYQVLYSYLKFRPQFFVGAVGDNQNSVFYTSQGTRREDTQFAGVAYPLDRFDKAQFQLQATQRRTEYGDDPLVTFRPAGHENSVAVSFQRDVSEGRYLETTRGYRVQVNYEDSNRYLDSSTDYRDVFAQFTHFQPFHKESTFALRMFGGAGFGGDRQLFRTGGVDMLRGFGRYDADGAASRFVISNLEYRFPLLFDVNYHIWFFFPDFLFKNVYGSVFTDNGVIWNQRDDLLGQHLDDVRNSVGLGLRFEAFVLQTFPVSLEVDWAHRTRDGEDVFYFGLGPDF